MKVLAFVPVRCGSKSISFKNIKLFFGQPLVYWCLRALQDTELVEEIVVATDCDEIARVVKDFDFSKVIVYQREEENAADNASTESVMLEYIGKSNLSPELFFMLVQATSPFTTPAHFTDGIELLHSGVYDAVLSGVSSKRFFWNPINNHPINYDVYQRPRRQDFDGLVMENGAFYISRVSDILESKNRVSGNIGLSIMPEYTGLELDESIDWLIGERIMKAHQGIVKTSNIRLFLTDVDGVLTDGSMYYAESGDELKRFCTYDGKGIEILKKQGILTGIITSESVNLVNRRAEKLKMDYFYLGVTDKLSVVVELCGTLGISLNEVAYIGDDVNDVELLSSVGLAACPANAVKQIKEIEGIIHLHTKGGDGAVREFVEEHIVV